MRFYAERIGAEMSRQVVITEPALELLERWRWPGNVRELKNEIRRAAALSRGPIGPEDLSPTIQKGA